MRCIHWSYLIPLGTKNIIIIRLRSFNTLRPRQHGHHFSDDIFKYIFVNENVWISIKFSLNIVLGGPINNIPSLVQIMAWRRLGDKPLSEPMMVLLLTHICVTRPQWVKLASAISTHPETLQFRTTDNYGRLAIKKWGDNVESEIYVKPIMFHSENMTAAKSLWTDFSIIEKPMVAMLETGSSLTTLKVSAMIISGATSGDKFRIMTTLGFRYLWQATP